MSGINCILPLSIPFLLSDVCENWTRSFVSLSIITNECSEAAAILVVSSSFDSLLFRSIIIFSEYVSEIQRLSVSFAGTSRKVKQNSDLFFGYYGSIQYLSNPVPFYSRNSCFFFCSFSFFLSWFVIFFTFFLLFQTKDLIIFWSQNRHFAKFNVRKIFPICQFAKINVCENECT